VREETGALSWTFISNTKEELSPTGSRVRGAALNNTSHISALFHLSFLQAWIQSSVWL
jgi:hypothetical protein